MTASEHKPHKLLGRTIGVAIGLAFIVATFAFVLPQIANYQDVWRVFERLSWREAVLLAAAVALSLSTYGPTWIVALPHLRYRQAFVVTQASTASTYVAPGGPTVGIAVSLAMLKGWGFKPQEIARATTLTGVWNQLAVLGFPAVALAFLTLEGGANPLLQTVALIGLACFCTFAGGFALGLASKRLARKAGDLAARIATFLLRLVRRGPSRFNGSSFVRFRNETIGLIAKRWHLLTFWTLTGQLTTFLVLLASLRVLGVSGGQVDLIEAFSAFSIVRLAQSLPITPGGVGVVELGLIAVLTGFGGSNAGVVAAVLLYRFLTLVPTLLLGLIAGATWRHHRPRVSLEGPAPASETTARGATR
jgi:putative heme transporter